jgi:Flp pilus assembly protein TadD
MDLLFRFISKEGKVNKQAQVILEETDRKKQKEEADPARVEHAERNDSSSIGPKIPDHDLNQNEIDLSTESSSLEVEMTPSHTAKGTNRPVSEKEGKEKKSAAEEDRISVLEPDEMAYQTEAYPDATECVPVAPKEPAEKKRTTHLRTRSKKSKLHEVEGNRPDRSAITHRKADPKQPQTISQPVSISKGVAYLMGNTIKLTGGVKLLPGDEIKVKDKEFVLRAQQKKPVALYAAAAVVLLLGLILFTPLFHAHNRGNLVGVVLDENTRYPLPQAKVNLKETGKSIQTNPLGFFVFEDLSPGLYSVETSNSGYRTKKENVTITKDQSTTLGILLSPLSGDVYSQSPSPGSPSSGSREANAPEGGTGMSDYGSIRIKSNISDPVISVDNKTVGTGNKLYQKIAPGTHRITVSKEGYFDWVGEAKVNPGETLNLQVQLSEDKGTQATPSTWSDYLNLGNLQKSSGDLTQALSSFDQALSLKPDAPEALQGRGNTYLLSGDKTKATADLEQAGKLYLNRQDYKSAILCFNDLLSFNDKSPSYLLDRGICFLKTGQYQNSIPDLKKASELDPGLFAGYLNLGEAYGRAGDYKLAIDSYKRARKLNQKSPEVYLGLIQTYYAQGDKSEAKKSYRKYEELSSYLDREKMKQDPKWNEMLKDIGITP